MTAERVVEVTTDADGRGRRTPANVAVVGDPGAVTADLAERVAVRVPEGERERRRERVAGRDAETDGDRPPGATTGRARGGADLL